MKRTLSDSDIAGWFAGRIPDGWFTGPPEVTMDRDEILIVGELPEPQTKEETSAEAARLARIEGWREDSRGGRVRIALDAEYRFRRKVSWGAACGDTTRFFTTLAAPAMTRLRMPEREVLDTLVDSGVARSRSEALAWCVRLVAKNQDEWLADLRSAFEAVERVREEGPSVA